MPESVPLPLKGTLVNQTQLERQVANVAKKAGRNLKIDLGTNAKDIKSLEQPLGRITGQADEFGKSMQAANARVIAFGASVGIINAVVQSFKSLVTTTIEVEASLAKINSILNTTVSGLDSLKGQIFDIARNTQQTFDTVADAALELSRQGLNATEVAKRLNDALILSRLSGINAAEAVAGLTAAVNSFSKEGLTTGEVLNKVSNAANKFAVSERDLIEGFKRSASVAQQAGVSIDELGGIITAVQQKTARGGAVIGNSFKTIFTRIGRAGNLQLLESLGVQITDVQGKILPATKLIENLAGKLGDLNDIQVRSITEKIGGGFQIAPLLAALSDYSSETSIAIQATEAFRNATDQAYQKNIILNETLSAAITRTSLTVKELANNLGELGVTDTFKELLNIVNNFVSSVNNFLDGEGPGAKFAKGFLSGLSGALVKGGLAIFGVLLFQLSKQLLKFGVDSFKTFLGLNKEAERLKSIQQQIVGTLLNDQGVRENILRIENSSLTAEQKRFQQAEFFNVALRERVKLTSQLNTLSSTIAPGIVSAGRSGATKRSAGGFLPIGAEQKDISRGVGGAPSSAKPVVIPNFAFGNGKKGTMVANSSEYIVPNFAGGGSAIFNQDMVKRMGLPSGAKKVNAAGGYIPNFASKVNKGGSNFVLLTGSYGNDSPNASYFGAVDKDGETRIYVSPQEALKQGFKSEAITEVAVPTFQAKKPKGDTNGKSYIDSLEGKIRDLGANEAVKTALSISSPGNVRTESAEKLKGRFQKGAVNSLAGSVFEVALASILEGPGFDDYASRTENSLIDLPKSDNLYAAFGVGKGQGKDGAEVKGSNSTELQKSAAKKFFDVLVGGRKAFERKQGSKETNLVGKKLLNKDAIRLGFLKLNAKGKYPNRTYTIKKNDLSKLEGESFTSDKTTGVLKRAASGYIPNFAQNQSPLEQAIGRERDAGIPINQIRINQDGKLRNSQNPDGIAVTNTRDEPTGAVPRNASRGFVPNFIGPGAGVGEAAKANVGALKKQTESSVKLTKANQGQLVASEKSTSSYLKASGVFFIAQSVLGGLATQTEGTSKAVQEFAQAALTSASILFGLQSVGLTPGIKRGAAKSGPNKAGSLGFKGAKLELAGQKRSALGLRGGGLLRSSGKFVSVLGKAAGIFGRFVPILGTVITLFPILNAVIKKATGGFDTLSFLLDGLKGIGRVLGFIDTPAEAAAKSLEKLRESSLDAALSLDKGGESPTDLVLKELRLKIRGIEDKDGKVITDPKEIITSVLNKGRADGIGKETRGIADQSLISTLSTQDKQKLLEKPEDVQKLLGQQQSKLSKEDQSKREDAIKKEIALRERLAKIDGDKSRVVESKQILKEIEKEVVLRGEIEKKLIASSDAADRLKKIQEDSRRVLRDTALSALDSVIAQQKSIAAIKSEKEFKLELLKASEKTNAIQGAELDRRLQNLQVEKGLQEEISDIFTKRILSDEGLKTSLIPDVGGTIDAQAYQQIADLVLNINDNLLKTGKFEGDIVKFAEERLSRIEGIAGKEKEVIASIKQSVVDAAKRAAIAKADNDLQNARLKLLKLQSAEEKRINDLRDRRTKKQRDIGTSALNAEQRQIDIERARLDAGKAGRKGTTADVRASNALDLKQTDLDIRTGRKAATEAQADDLVSQLRAFSDVIDPSKRKSLEDKITGSEDILDLAPLEVSVGKLIEKSITDSKKLAEDQAKKSQKLIEDLKSTLEDGLRTEFGANVNIFGANVNKFGEYIAQALAESRAKEKAGIEESELTRGPERNKEFKKAADSLIKFNKNLDDNKIKLNDLKSELENLIIQSPDGFGEDSGITTSLTQGSAGAQASIEGKKAEIKVQEAQIQNALNQIQTFTQQVAELKGEELQVQQRLNELSVKEPVTPAGDPAGDINEAAKASGDLKVANEEQKTSQTTLTTSTETLNRAILSLTPSISSLFNIQKVPQLGAASNIFDLNKPTTGFIGSAEGIGLAKQQTQSEELRKGTESYRKGLEQSRIALDKGTIARLRADAALKDFTGSLKTLASLIRSEFENIPEQRAQNTFDILTTADPGALQSAGVNQGRLDILQSGEGTQLDRIRQANEYVLAKEKELALLKTIDTASRVQLEYEYEINLKILALRERLNAAKTPEERGSVLREAAILERQKDNPDIGTLFKKQGKSPEESAKEIREILVSGATNFVDTLSDGLVDSISKGESLRDTLREAASSFLEDFAKTSLKNLLRGVVFGQGEGGFQGILGSIFGQKDSGAGSGSAAGATLINSARGLTSSSPLYVTSTDGEGLTSEGGGGESGGIDIKGGALKAISSVIGKDISGVAGLLGLGGESGGPKGSQSNPVFVNVVNGGGGGGGGGIQGSTGGGGGFLGGAIGSLASLIPGVGPVLGPILGAIGFNEGGSVPGRVTGGSGVRDDVPAVLMAGEYVIRKSAVQKYGSGMMESINSGNLTGFATGGMVGGARSNEPINEYMGYRRSINESDRTQSGIIASDWTPKASKYQDQDKERTVDQEERTESGVLASKWIAEASIQKARKKKTEERIRIRTESGIESSEWTPLANSSTATREARETKKDSDKSRENERTNSGIVASNWTSKSNYSNVEKEEERLKNRELRSDSGNFISKWTDSANYAKEKTRSFEDNNELRNDSGLKSSDWTPKADVIRESNEKRRKKEEENRTESGLTASKFTPAANSGQVYNLEERFKNKDLRFDSGAFASKWIDSFKYAKEKKERVDQSVKFRSESGIEASKATRESSLRTSFDPKFGGVLDERLTNLRVSESKDKKENPALLMGGEFVMSKDAVSSFGTSFLDAINNGSVKKYAKGGLVPGATFAREEKDFKTTDIFGSPSGALTPQTGRQDFIIPGLYGQGQIEGAGNLLNFSTQAFTGGQNDVINQAAGASMVSLEPESVRLTNFGRTRGTPLQRATQDAKAQAFGLNLEYQQQVAEYNELVEQLKKQEKERKKQLLTQLAISVATMGLTAGLNGIGAAMNNGGVAANGGFWNSFLRGAPGSSGSGTNTGGLLNLRGYNLGGTGSGQSLATGGYVTGGGSNIDNVQTMLTGGEFVLNRAATERVGADNLQNLNSGGGEDSEKVIEKLDEILNATRDNNGEINITVNGGGGGNENSGGGGSSGGPDGNATVEKKGASNNNKYREELGKTIKQKVLEVLREERRLGGTLR